jgi:hypothetical protein
VKTRRKNWRKTHTIGHGCCGAEWTNERGAVVQHCGHPTALYPYLVFFNGLSYTDPITGRGFRHLKTAQEFADQLPPTT